ncbi:hypothetical protein AM387_22755 [Klebsiella pneumoniae]|nr:hypothetical protein AM388_02265 [Klebsiella pneumoniae]AWD94254.1 hypothetical protein AM389_02320 [Klebsiella pneumoniae]AWD94289.1 hypothetical protein AM389_02525 [Klebsiella pneumoniae]AWS86197.1 hypothetical protein AM387_22755 [Klebsiella pneumoniae]HBY6918338.1 hypothetical protein [Klebsiella pneumoniae]
MPVRGLFSVWNSALSERARQDQASAFSTSQSGCASSSVSNGFVNGMVASHLLCHSGTINRHSLNGALLS